MPGETLMLISGFMSAGVYALVFLFIGGTLGTFTGSQFAYRIGQRYGENLVLKIGRPLHITKENLLRAKALMEKHQTFYILFSRFVPGFRHIMPYLCGIIGLNLKKYVSLNLLSSVLWCGVFLSAGRFFGKKWQLFESLVRSYSVAALIILIFLYLVYKFGGKHRIMISGIFLPAAGFAAIALLQARSRTHLFDSAVYAFLAQLSFMRPVFSALSGAGSMGFIAAVSVICALFLLRYPGWSFYGKMVPVNAAACFLIAESVSLLFHRSRPEMPALFSVVFYGFPSVNAMLSVAFYGFIIRLACKAKLPKTAKIAACTALVLVIMASGISTISLHTYYASDVLAGYSAGIAWLVLFSSAIEKLRPDEKSSLPQIR